MASANKMKQSLIKATFFLLLIAAPLTTRGATLLDYIVAVVNDAVIVHSQLAREVRLTQKKLREQGIPMPAQTDLEKRVLDSLIITLLQLQLAQRLGITVEDDDLNNTLRKIAGQNNMNLQQLKATLEQEGYHYARFREDIRKELIIKNLQQRQVINRITVTEREIDNFLANQAQQGTEDKEYHLLHILIATPEAASPEQIEAKRQEAQAVLTQLRQGADFQATAVTVSDSRQALAGGDLGWLKGGEIPSLFADLVDNMAVGEISEPIRNASGFHIIKLLDKQGSEALIITQTQIRHILIKTSELISDFEAKIRLEDLKSRIELGEPFTELAQATSEDPASAAEGGLIGWVNPGDMTPEFEEEMNRLADNQISEPFKSRYGWHIIQVLARRQHDDTQKALRTKAGHQIQQRKIEEELQAWLRQLRDEAYVEHRLSSLQDAVD